MPDVQRVALTCDQCGQTDDHPKVHIGEVTKHHDCLNFQEDEMVRTSSPQAATIIDDCKGGLRGEKLLARIEKLHSSAKGK